MEEMDTASATPVSGNGYGFENVVPQQLPVSVNGTPNGSREVEAPGESLEDIALPPKCHSTGKPVVGVS